MSFASPSKRWRSHDSSTHWDAQQNKVKGFYFKSHFLMVHFYFLSDVVLPESYQEALRLVRQEVLQLKATLSGFSIELGRIRPAEDTDIREDDRLFAYFQMMREVIEAAFTGAMAVSSGHVQIQLKSQGAPKYVASAASTAKTVTEATSKVLDNANVISKAADMVSPVLPAATAAANTVMPFIVIVKEAGGAYLPVLGTALGIVTSVINHFAQRSQVTILFFFQSTFE